MTLSPSPLLRHALVVDAAVSGATGLLMLVGSGLLSRLLGLPAGLLFYAGLALLPYAALVAFLGTRAALPRSAVWAVIIGNLAWAAASIALLLTGWVDPTGLGYAFVIGQALVVAAFGEAQYFGLRRPAAAGLQAPSRS